MTKPMYCPMSFMRYATNTAFEKQYTPLECTPDCAWAVKYSDESFGCCMALQSVKNTPNNVDINTRLLEDDAEDKHSDMSPEVQQVYNDLMHKLVTGKFKDDAEWVCI